MIERADRADFPFESLDALAVAGELQRQHLERDPSMQAFVIGQVDLAHAAFADLLDHSVRPDGRANHGGS